MKITLVGCGCGSLTQEAQNAIDRAELLIGSERLLKQHAGGRPAVEAVSAESIREAVRDSDLSEICVLFSGDSGFYSGARRLLPLLAGGQDEIRLLPGVSSVQHFAARLCRPWQDWGLYSAHGTDCDVLSAVCTGKPAFFLTGGKRSPDALCRELTAAGLGFLRVSVGENLGTEQERVRTGTAEELAAEHFEPLSVLLAEPAPVPERCAPGLPDDSFSRTEKVPMTKQEIRAAALAKLGVGPADVCWDIGAGTGSVSVELALLAGAVYAVEQNAGALRLAEENRRKHKAWKLRLVEGTAPEALRNLPAPDAVFVGGSGGRLRAILGAVHEANPLARICVSAVTLETLQQACEELRALGCRTEVCQIAVSRSREAGGLTMMLAQNPVWLISGTAP